MSHARGAIVLAVATGTTISCSLGRWNAPVVSMSFYMPLMKTDVLALLVVKVDKVCKKNS
jgi:hypothetical protein